MMYSWKGEVPEDDYTVPLGEAVKRKEGKDVTIIGFSKPMRNIEEAAEGFEKRGINCEVIDIRSIRPFDEETVFESVKKTNRIVIVDEAWPVASVGAWIASLVTKQCFDYLDAPPELVAMEDVPMPYNRELEKMASVGTDKIIKGVERVLYL